jgi:hypothetical protein
LFRVDSGDNRTRGDFDGEIFAAFAGFLFALTVAAVGCFKVFFVTEMVQGSLAGGNHKDYISPGTPVPAVGSAPRDKSLTPETYTAAASISGLNRDNGFINEFHSA